MLNNQSNRGIHKMMEVRKILNRLYRKRVISSGAGWSRLFKHSLDKNIGILTAFRGENTYKKNKQLNKQLADDIRSAGFGFVNISGSYIENFKTDNENQVD